MMELHTIIREYLSVAETTPATKEIVVKPDSATKPAGVTAGAKGPPVKAEKPQPEASAAEVITYEQVQKIVVEIVKSPALGRPSAVELLSKFDAKTGLDLKPHQYAAFYQAAKELLATVAV